MLDLIRFLAESPYASGLFPYTSMDKLCLGRVPDFSWFDNELRIEFNSSNHSFKFIYFQNEADARPWSRDCTEEEWKPVLEHILQKRLGWFHSTTAA